MPARMAFPAHDLRFYRYLISYPEPGYIRTDFNDISRDLMALCDWILSERMLSMIDMDITSADSYHPDSNKDLIICYRGNIYLAE